jgi:uncharacterized membrane-anchored protein YhcB (DUF1043 family)
LSGWDSLQEHIGVVVGLLGIFATGVLALFWRIITSLEKRQERMEEALNKHKEDYACKRQKCREELITHFISKNDFDRLDKELWEAINQLRRGEWRNKSS